MQKKKITKSGLVHVFPNTGVICILPNTLEWYSIFGWNVWFGGIILNDYNLNLF